eukprot:c28493_g1_i3 orf=307-2301(-)
MAYDHLVLSTQHVQCPDVGYLLPTIGDNIKVPCKLNSTFFNRNLSPSLSALLSKPFLKKGSKGSELKGKRPQIWCCGTGVADPGSDKILCPSTSSPNLLERLASSSLTEFRMSDFNLCPHVSIGLAGRGDEVVYEGVVENPNSPLKGSKVVVRQLVSPRAQRWGKRALQHYDNYSLHHWLLCEDWLPTLEARLSLDEECGRRVGDDRTGGPTVSRQLRLVQILMRDLLIGVNYLHSHGLAHTELRLQNVQISDADRHVKVGLLGNAADFADGRTNCGVIFKSALKNVNRRQLMIAYDIRCVGIMMARMVLRELMDPTIFTHFKAFLTKGNDSSALREFLLKIINKKSPTGSLGLQILDRDAGSGWNLLSLMLATNPSKRVSCTEALRHPFLCGPRWRVESTMDMTRWSIGSTAVRIVEEYIYGAPQRNKLAQLIDLLEMINLNTSPKSWLELLAGKWRLVYHTGRHIGLTLRQAVPTVLVDEAVQRFEFFEGRLSMTTDVNFTAMPEKGDWAPNKIGMTGCLQIVSSSINISSGERSYTTGIQMESDGQNKLFHKLVNLVESSNQQGRKDSGIKRLRKVLPATPPLVMPVIRFNHQDCDVSLKLDDTGSEPTFPIRVLQELRIQIPPETFDISGIICGTYIDARLLVLRGISGAAFLLVRSPIC